MIGWNRISAHVGIYRIWGLRDLRVREGSNEGVADEDMGSMDLGEEKVGCAQEV